MTALDTLGARSRPPNETIDALWEELIEEVRRVLRLVDEEQRQDHSTHSTEDRDHEN